MGCGWADYFNKLRVVNNQVVKQYSNEVKNVLREQLNTLWYERKDKPTMYIRTSELLESISVTKLERNGKYGAKATVYFDSSRLSHSRQESGWGQHMSMDGTPIGDILGYWIDQGNGNSFYHYDGVNYIQATLNEVKAICYQTQKKLNSMGYNVEII